MISVDNLAKSYGRRTLWSNLTYTAETGEMLALIGASGAGKSTLLNCLGLLETPDHGRIQIDDHEITRLGPRARRRFRRDTLGYLFQNYALIENATVWDNLDAAIGTRGRTLRHRRPHYHTALERVGLADRTDEKVYRLSGGEQQRVALARLLVKNPTLILADEPTGALDDTNEQMVIDTLRDMSTHGSTVIIATHRHQVHTQCDSTLKVG